MARARQIPDLSPQDAYGAVAAKTIVVRAEEVFARHDEVLVVEDIEALHDMRVATRRLRAALEVFEPCFPRHAFRRVLAEVKRLADALGERRDRDVQIEWLERYASERAGDERAAVLGFVEGLRAEQTAANEALATLLEETRRDELERRLHALADDAQPRRHDAHAGRARAAKKARRAGKREGKDHGAAVEQRRTARSAR